MSKALQNILFFIILGAFSLLLPERPAVASGSGEGAAEADAPKKKKVRLSQRRFYTLQPFTVPLLSDGHVSEQFTIVISLELIDEEDRIDIAYAVPRIRNELYNELLHLVTFRRKGETIPQIGVFKQQLLKVAQRILGDEKIRSLVVQQAFKAKTP